MRLTKVILNLILIAIFTIGTAHARFGAAPEGWPCIQPYVAEVSAGAFWTGELPDSADWQGDETLARLADEASDRKASYEQSLDKVKAFLSRFDENSDEQKREKAALLVVALTDTINDKRKKVLKGIDRFAERQQMMITRIEDQDKKIRYAQKDDSPSANAAALEDLEIRQKWDIRVFEERESQKNYLCEQAVLLEQRFFLLGREIAAWLGSGE